MPDSLLTACFQAPKCLAPGRIAHSHWAGHLPFAFWLAEILKPQLFVELGAYQGVSFCAFCQQIDRLGLACEAYAIDNWQGDQHMGQYGSQVYEELSDYVQTHYPGFASLLRMDFDQALPQFQNGSIDLLHIDGCHTASAILHDFEAWLPKMSERGVILLHDIAARLPDYGGVEAWESIASRFPTFAFKHGYGLGIVLTGAKQPQVLQELANADEQVVNLVRQAFQGQARIYEILFALESQRKNERIASETREKDQAAKFAELERIVNMERLRRADEEAQWREKLLASELKNQAYSGSLSWKITAPLRKLAALWQ